MKILTAPFAILVSTILLVSTPVFSQGSEQANIEFAEGSVLVYCTAPNPDSDAHMKVFLDSFPKLIENMQLSANNGELLRAHYLGRLKEGFFFAFHGESIEEAQSKADKLLAESDAIVSESLKTAGVTPKGSFGDNCNSLEIGPLAVKSLK